MRNKRIWRLGIAGVLILAAAGCATRSRGARLAIDLLRGSEFESLSRSIEFTSFNSFGSSATAEGTVTTAFRFAKEKNKWVLKEVRVGEARWESIRDLKEALDSIHIRRTRADISIIVEALERYHSRNSAYPEAQDIADLIDQLSPAYLDRVLRLDGWGHEFRITAGQGKPGIVSNGPDGKENSADDVRAP